MSKHTPGPWDHYEAGVPGEERITIRSGQLWIAQAGQETRLLMPLEEHRANARLIAAAPEMLEALAAYAFATRNNANLSRQYKAAMAAIAKAEGK